MKRNDAMYIAMLLFVMSSPLRAAWVGMEGEEWIKWDNTTRQAYVRAYVHGMLSGFGKGCDEGIFAALPKAQGKTDIRIAHECYSHCPISNRDSLKMVDTVTMFYRKYPEQRYLYIEDILLRLHRGESIEQIHSHFAGAHK